MHYYLYEIKNTVNGKIYVGVHKTKSLSDGYMGSGKIINLAIKKHGIENFTKTILEYFDNSAAMFARENEVVTDEFLARDDTYNLRRGGTGGFDYINRTIDMVARNTKAARNGNLNDKRSNAVITLWGSVEYRNKQSQRDFTNFRNAGRVAFKNKKHSDATKNKIRVKSSISQQGEKNSQFGTCWMYCEWLKKNIKVKNDLVPYYIDQGWSKGRK